jgi:DnaJ-class molecular chaperone
MPSEAEPEKYEQCLSCEGTGREKDGFSEQTLEFSYGDKYCSWCRGSGQVAVAKD